MLMEPEVLATKWHRWEATFRSVYNPPEVGDWSFVSTCSHRDNHGLHEQRGSFNCAESRRADTLPAARPHPALSEVLGYLRPIKLRAVIAVSWTSIMDVSN